MKYHVILQAVLQHKESAGCVPVEEVVGAVSQLISDSDLLLTNASLAVATSLLRCHPSSAPAVAQALLPPALHLSQSSLLQVCPYLSMQILCAKSTAQ